MSELFNVNTFIMSQVNPHVMPFVAHEGGGILDSKIEKQFTVTLKAMIGNEIRHVLDQIYTVGAMPPALQRMTNIVF